MILQSLTPSEEEIMRLVWNKGQIYFRELMDIFPEPKPHQNTVSTFLKILVDKHYLSTEKEGRIYRYSPSISFDEYQKFVLKRFLESYFDNSGDELLKVLINENYLNPQDISNLPDANFNTKPSRKTDGKENHIQDLIKEITGEKKSKKKDKKVKKKGKKK